MNHTYRLVWHRVLAMFVAVSECARSMGKRSGGKAGAVAALVLAVACAPAVADPAVTVIDTAQPNYSASALATDTTIQFQGGTLLSDVNGALQQNVAVGSQGGAINQNGHAITFSGTLSDAPTGVGPLLIMNTGPSTGAVTFSGTATYSGQTTVGSYTTLALVGAANVNAGVTVYGVLDLTGPLAGSRTATALLAGNGQVVLGNHNTLDLTAGNAYFNGVISGNGSLRIAGGTETLTTAQTYIGQTIVDQGAVLVLNRYGSLSAQSSLNMNGTLDLAGALADFTTAAIDGAGSILLGARNVTVAGGSGAYDGVMSGSGGLTVANATESLSNRQAYTGLTQIGTGGNLHMAGAGSIAASAGLVNNGVFDITVTTQPVSIATLSGNGSVLTGAGTSLTLTAAADNFSGSITGGGSLTVAAGTATLSGANSHTGGTTIAPGATLALAGAGSIDASGLVDQGAFDISGAGAGVRVKGLTGAGTVVLGANTLGLHAAAGAFDGVISGSGGLAVDGGAATLTAAQTYTGATTVASGASLTLSGAASIAASSALVADGSVDVSGLQGDVRLATLAGSGLVNLGANGLTLTAASSAFAGAISGTGRLAIAAGTATLGGVNTYTGATQIAPGATLALTNARAVATSAVVDNGVLDIGASHGGASVASITGSGAVKLGAGQLVVSNAAGTFSGAVAGSGGLRVASGVQTLTGINTYTGLTEIGAGAELAITGDGSITSSSGVLDNGTLTVATNQLATMTSLSGSGTLNLAGQSVTFTQGSDKFTGNITGTGKIIVTGGMQELTGQNTSTGAVSVTSGGVLKVAADTGFGAADNGVVLNNGTVENTAMLTMARTVDITGAGTFLTDAGTTLVANGAVTGSGTLVKAGAGMLVLSGDNRALAGGVAVNAGTLKVLTVNSLGNGTLHLNGGMLEAAANLTLAQNVTVAGGAGIVVDAATTTLIAGALTTAPASAGCFSKAGAGTLTLTGSGAFGTGLCIAEGMLRANGTLGAGFIHVAATGTLRGAGSISGPLTVGGVLAPGNSPGTLRASSSVTMLAGSTFQEDINGTGTGTGPGSYSRLLITGAGQFAAGGATLAPNLVNVTGTDTYTAYVPKVGDSFRIVTAAGGLVGRFAPLVQPAGLAAGTRLGVFYDLDSSHSIDLRVLPVSYAALVTGNGNADISGAVLDQIMTADQAGTATAVQSRIASTLSSFGSSAVATLTQALSGQVHAAMAAAAPLAGQALQGTVTKQLDQATSNALWADLGANRAAWDRDAHASSFLANRGQLTIGADAFRNDADRLGLGFTHARANLAADAGAGTLRDNLVFMYGQHQGDVIGIDAMAGAGRTSWETERANPLGAGALVTGLDGRDSLASIGLSTPWRIDGALFKPFVRVLWQRTGRDAGDEGAASAALALGGYAATGTRTTVGVSGNRPGSESGDTMQYSVGVGRDNGALTRPTVATTLAGIASTVTAPHAGRDFLQVAVSGTVVHSADAASYYGIATELHSGRVDVSVSGGLRYAF